jgi:hypothetical protein
MMRILKVQSLWVRPVEAESRPGRYALDVELRVRMNDDPSYELVARVSYVDGREVGCELSPEPAERAACGPLAGIARRAAHDALSPDNGALPNESTVTFPVPIELAFKFQLIGNDGSAFMPWEPGEEF